MKDSQIVVEQGSYYHKECKVAGRVVNVTLGHPHNYVTFEATGTTNDALLQYLSGHPGGMCRGHLCEAGCNGEEVADDLIHIVKLRKKVDGDQEEGWCQNLEKVLPLGADELGSLRERAREIGLRGAEPEAPGKEAEKDKEKSKEKDKKASKKDKKKKKEDGKEKKKKKKSEDDEDSRKESGRKPKVAAQRSAKALYSGTGLDAREKIRNRVAKRARAYMQKKKEEVSSSSSGSNDSSSTSSVDGTTGADTLFGESSKVRALAMEYPGALACQALQQMKTTLVQEAGLEEMGEKLTPVATSYYRQHLQRKAPGPVGRELQTLAAIIDALIKCKPCHAADLAVQRLKSIEQGLTGIHWVVAQRLEVLPQDHP